MGPEDKWQYDYVEGLKGEHINLLYTFIACLRGAIAKQRIGIYDKWRDFILFVDSAANVIFRIQSNLELSFFTDLSYIHNNQAILE